VIALAKVTDAGCCRWFPGCCCVFWWLLRCWIVISGVFWVVAYQPKSRTISILVFWYGFQINFRIGV